MKAVLKFDMETIDDELALNRALKSTDMACVLFELQNNLQKKCYNEISVINTDMKEFDAVEFVFKKIYGLIDEYNINLEDLIR